MSEPAQKQPGSVRPALQLHNPGLDCIPTEPTLREAFDEYVAPETSKTTTSGAQSDNERFLGYWEEYQGILERGDTRTENTRTERPYASGPPIKEIRSRDVAAFRDWIVAPVLSGGRGLANSTSSKAVKLLKRILRLAAEDYDVRSINTKTLTTKAAAKHFLRADEIEALWSVADRQRWPAQHANGRFVGSGLPPGDYWRAILILASAYGMRVQDLARYSKRPKPPHYTQRRYDPICWRDVFFDVRSPHPEGRSENALGWLTYCASKTGREYCLPMTRPVRAAIDRLAAAACDSLNCSSADLPGERPILPTPLATRGMSEAWRLLQAAAGVSNPDGEPYDLKSFRKLTASTLQAVHADLPYIVCGWSTARSDVAAKHYLSSEETLVKFLPQVNYPACFDQWKPLAEAGSR